ncbi:MAG: hypothetical protein QOE62_3946 [Actinomycetota bacterium]|nr:hypothetical protein [Actinomycetota bacterium]
MLEWHGWKTPARMRRISVRTCIAIAVVVSSGLIAVAPASAAPSWSLATNPSPPAPPALDLTAVTCPSPTICFALGRSTAIAAGTFVAERWNGSAWTNVAIANPAAPAGSALVDVSCSGPSDCFAVGSSVDPARTPLMERWNGSAWSIVTAPTPAGASEAWLTGVSCPTATFCLATGNRDAGAATASPYGAQWNGSSWTLVPMPSPANPIDVRVDEVSCVTTTTCFAVGFKETNTTPGRTLVERWNGSAWSIMASPTPAGVQQIRVSDVSCSGTTSCFAVGRYPTASGSSHPFSLRWNGTAWSIVAFPSPAGGSGDVHDVSCVSSTSCVAAGAEDDYVGAGQAWIQSWNGTKWTAMAHPSAGRYSSLGDIACPSSAACIAVGLYQPLSSSKLLSLTERWNGTAWSISAPPAGGSQSQLEQVSCPTTTFCFAVGHAVNTSLTPLAKRWDGTSWTIVALPRPAGSSNTTLTGVSCTSSTSCFAVGYYFASANSVKTLTERWNGTAWTIVPSPNPANQNATLRAVSCHAATSCTAIGSGDKLRVMVERWNGSVWAITNGMSDTTKNLQAVSCPAATSCIAVGSNGTGTFARHWNGSMWATVATPNPSGSFTATLGSVSCTSPTDCTAVGSSAVSGGNDPLVEHWNGTAWSIQASPKPAGSTVHLQAVSCATSTNCVAVGYRSPAGSNSTTLIEQWDGTTWTVVPSPNRPGTSFGILLGVSCATSTNCKAVGWAASNVYDFTLIEHYQ